MRDSKQQAVQDLGSPRNPALVLYCVTTSSKYSTVRTYGWCERDEYSDLGTSEWHRVMICNECLD